jgi:hypothetical protein
MTPIETDRKRILEIQKELIASILDFQVQYGIESVAGWNVAVNFAVVGKK